MTSKEFVVWMRGFVTACNDYSPTPKQWDIMKDELAEVKDEPTVGKFDYTYKFPQQQPKVESNQLELNFEKEFTDEEIDAAIAEFNYLESLDD